MISDKNHEGCEVVRSEKPRHKFVSSRVEKPRRVAAMFRGHLKRTIARNFRTGIDASLLASTDTREQRERNLFSALLEQDGPLSDLAVVNLIRDRLPLAVVDRMIAEGVRQQEIFDLVAPRRTLTHRKGNQEPLTVEESDRAARLARTVARSEAVFGNKEKAMSWLRRPMTRFSGKTPLEMLETDLGSRLVEEALIQIDEGFFA